MILGCAFFITDRIRISPMGGLYAPGPGPLNEEFLMVLSELELNGWDLEDAS